MAAPVLAGEILAGKYRVERLLGQGGMGVVVAARHVELDDLVALKFLLPGALSEPEAVARFLKEARASVRIKSEHVARVHDIGQLESGAPYIVMEYLDGSDLAAVLRARGALPVEDVVDYVAQACEGMAAAHAVGIVHRDLKPSNFMLVLRSDGSECVKVLDFGIVDLGGGNYVYEKENGMAYNGNSVKVEILKEAAEFCKKQGKQMSVQSSAAKPYTPYSSYAGAEVQFSCI